MSLQSISLTPQFQQTLFDTFENMDMSLIKDALYFDGWQTYEESGGVFIFQGIDDSYHYCEFGYCVMASSHDIEFSPIEISYDEAVLMSQRWAKSILDNENWWAENS